MPDKPDKIIRYVYKKWKSTMLSENLGHPDEEALAGFIDGLLASEEEERIKEHLVACDICAQEVGLALGGEPLESRNLPEELLARLKEMLKPEDKSSILEIALLFKEKLLEFINTNGDVLVGQELIPAPVLRSRSIRDFKDEISILKDFKDIRVEVKIENKGGKAFDLRICAKQKLTQKIIKDLRITLLKDNLELESRVSGSGSVTFEHVLLGKYTVEIFSLGDKLASVLLDIKA